MKKKTPLSTKKKAQKKSRIIEADEASALVQNTTEELWSQLMGAVKGIDGRLGWLIVGRIVALMFTLHFDATIDVAVEALEKEVQKP